MPCAEDWERFADAVERSHALAADALDNAVPATEHPIARARDLGAEAVSAFGAGFGGSVYAVVPTAAADAFAAEWHDHTLITQPGGPAVRLD